MAQRLHPDRQAGASEPERALAERRMREINQAWEVLRDPDRRRAYDQARLAASAGTAAPASTHQPPEPPEAEASAPGPAAGIVRHLPWLVVAVLLVAIFVFTAYAANPGKRTPLPTTTPPVAEGSCLDVFTGPSTSVVPCTGPHDLTLVARVADADQCPAGSEPRRLGTDGLVDCVVPS